MPPPPQGEWRPRQIDNPNYKGKWVHPEIDNPEYTPDPSIYAYDSFGVIGLDLWQVGGGAGAGGAPRGFLGVLSIPTTPRGSR